ncbi:MAG: hypothetical protein ACTSPV_14890 [Candidatus Hodarchaeales archaeon]
MDTDTIREKFIRSAEALDRLGNDIQQLIFSRAQELRESREYLETLIKEREAVDTQITEQEAKIAANQEEIDSKSNLKEELTNKRNASQEELQSKKNQLDEIRAQLKQLKEKIARIKEENEKLTKKISSKRDRIASLTQENTELEKKLTIELEEKKEKIAPIKSEIENTKSENGLISYLLEESAEDIPEVDILSTVMEKGRLSRDELKEALKDRISPVIVTRTLGRMAEKGLLDYDESADRITTR